jgi:predicted RNA-binding protein with TRAM domain
VAVDVTPRGGLTTVEISSELLCLFTADISSEDDDYVVELPRREIETGSVEPGKSYRVALISPDDDEELEGEPSSGEGAPGEPQPPVEPGEIRYVEIEDIGKQGDGIARVERGYVIIVPGTEIGERVKIEVTEVKSNFAVGEPLSENM